MNDPSYRDLIPYDTETGQGDIWQKGDEVLGMISNRWVPICSHAHGDPVQGPGRRPLKLLQEEKKHLPFISGGATIRKLHHEIADLKAQVSQLILPFKYLLARIHRDGGHHTEEVGIDQSTADADKIVADYPWQIQELTKERDDALEAHEGERLAKEGLLATVEQLTRAIHQIIKLSAMGSRDEIWRIATEAITSAKETP